MGARASMSPVEADERLEKRKSCWSCDWISSCENRILLWRGAGWDDIEGTRERRPRGGVLYGARRAENAFDELGGGSGPAEDDAVLW